MQTIARYGRRVGVLLLLAAVLVSTGTLSSNLPAQAAPSSSLPATPCVGTGATFTCELWAVAGTLTLPGTSVPFWGYAASATGAPTLPGPPLIVTAGASVTITLHNNLSEATALAFPGQALVPDVTGVAPGGVITYVVAAQNPGTYLYEAGLTTNGGHQVAMGMFGPLVVRAAGDPSSAYGNAASRFDDEGLVVLSEIDPALNNSANPAGFDMRAYAPKYRLMNGKAYSDSADLLTDAGRSVLLRYINAGLQHHTIGLLGLDQTVLAVDGSQLPYGYTVVAETLAPGQTADAITRVPASAGAGTRYALYDTSMFLHNNGAAAFGGMLTFLTVGGTPPSGDTAGPETTNLAIAPNLTNGHSDVVLSAMIDDRASGGSAIAGAEYFTHTIGVAGSGVPLPPLAPPFDTATESVGITLAMADVMSLSSGDHIFYVRGRDAAGNWGAVRSVILRLDMMGPATSGVVLTPDVSDGSVGVAIQATGDDTASGGSNVVAAEFSIDGTGGTRHPLNLNQIAPVASLNAIIPASTMTRLAQGAHTLHIHSQDALGNWGEYITTTLKIDKTGPSASGVSAAPNPNNGTLAVNPSTFAVRVDATLNDPVVNGANATIKAAEGFFDTVGAPGTGFPLTPSDGLFDSAVENAYAFIPLATVNALTEGSHTIQIRGKDVVGNWGGAGTTILQVDKTRPLVSNVLASPNPTNGAPTVTLTASATDPAPATWIAAAEWFEGTDPGVGSATAMAVTDGAFGSASEILTATINVDAWAVGNHTLSVRARDAAQNWSTIATTTLVIPPPDLIFADGFESGNFSAWTSATGARISVTAGAAISGSYGMQATMAGSTPGYVTDASPANETQYHARFYFNPNRAVTGNTQQDIFVGQNTAGTAIFRVQYRRTNAGGGTYQVRGLVLRAGGVRTTNWYTIANQATANVPHAIEIAWRSGRATGATAGFFSLYIDGVLRQRLNGINTSAYLLDRVRLGPSLGLVGGSVGTEYFDAFVSKRYSYIGP